MSSTILYKFRSGTNFESLPLPGTSARLMDIKRAIVKAKKLDRNTTTGSLDFDFAIQNANTNEEYTDDNMILPRGTRIIVRRVATERNHGLLHRMAAGSSMGGAAPPPSHHQPSAARSDFYTIRSHDRVDEDEFVDQDVTAAPQAAVVDESAELEALQAVTNQAASVYGPGGGGGGGGSNMPKSNYVAGSGGPSPKNNRMPAQFGQQQRAPRPNADPELRQQELPKKKTTTGIPRTFLSLNAPAPTPADGDNELSGDQAAPGEAGGLASQLNPNQHVFQALLDRAGGQSIDAAGKRRDLDYALKLTATSIPDHLQCGICHSVVKNAMLVPWDPEGRTTCESCIRDALAKGFKCPLTGTEGVSPDDLFPNKSLTKAADLFVKEVMEKMDQIEKQIEMEEAEEEKRNALAKEKEESNVFEGEAGESGTLLTRKTSKAGSGKKGYDDDLFGGGDDFGGDVFDVADPEEGDDEDMTDEPVTNASEASKLEADKVVDDNNNTKTETTDAAVSNANEQIESQPTEKKSVETEDAKKDDSPGESTNESVAKNDDPDASEHSEKNDSSHQSPSTNTPPSNNSRRKDPPKRRGPPAGYMLGPAGSSVPGGSPTNNFHPQHGGVPPPPPPRGPPMGRGPPPGMNGRGPPGGNYPDNNFGGRGRGGRQNFGRGHPGNDWNRKRGFDQMEGGGHPPNQEMMNQSWGGGAGQRDFNYRGNPNYQGGGGRGYYDGRGRGGRGPPPGGRGGFRGRGRGFGRGRY